MLTFNSNTARNALLRDVSFESRDNAAVPGITHSTQSGLRPGNLPRTRFQKFVDIVLCRQSTTDQRSERQTTTGRSPASTRSSALPQRQSLELSHPETAHAERFGAHRDTSPYKSFLEDDSKVAEHLREMLQVELGIATELLKSGPVILGEDHTQPAARAVLAELILSGHVENLFLELGSLDLDMFDNRPGTHGKYVTDHLREMAETHQPLQGDELWKEVAPFLEMLEARHKNKIGMVEVIEIATHFGVKVHWVDNAIEYSPLSASGMRNRNEIMADLITKRGGIKPGSVLLVGAAHTESEASGGASMQKLLGLADDRVKDLSSVDRKGKQRAKD